MKHTSHISLADLTPAVARETARLGARQFVRRIWNRDPSAFDADRPAPTDIANWLGWLRLPETMMANVPRLEKFAEQLRSDRFKDVVLLGMGGSSLAPIVLGSLFKPHRGFPKLHVLDSTDPGVVADIEKRINIRKTLFIVASKSGTTIEPNCFYKYFRGRVQAKSKQWAKHFVAITDENTALHKESVAEGLRDVFVAPSDVGGRYSALSYFGLVPAACIGVPLKPLLASAQSMSATCKNVERQSLAAQSGRPTPSSENSAFQLGVAMGAAAVEGRDKLTLIIPRAWQAFGLWIEQLVAESTGKQGKGIVPVSGETLAAPDTYGPDRFFVHVRVRGHIEPEVDRKVKQLVAHKHPVAVINVDSPLQISAEFFRWEFATATAGAVLGINPFDQPNVQAAKDSTNKIISQFVSTGKMPIDKPTLTQNRISIFAPPTLPRSDAPTLLRSFLSETRPGDYLALLAYLPMSGELEKPLQNARLKLGDSLRVTTTFGYGPRYLHSTGQLHKGGANNGIFIVITADPKKDLAIPGERFTFAQLELAQALGDAAALHAAGRRVLRHHLPSPSPAHVKRICQWITSAATK